MANALLGMFCSLASYLSSCIFFVFGQFNKIGASTYAVMEDEVSEANMLTSLLPILYV
jgi:hypothetical protein